MSASGPSLREAPLRRTDPPMLGDALLQGRLAATDSGVVYAARLLDSPVVVVVLSEGAEQDSFARARFVAAAATVTASDPDDVVVAAVADDEVAPWVVLARSAPDEALRRALSMLAAVDLADQPPTGDPTGPEFRPHWFQRAGVGRWRLWPLPWPRFTSAGRWTFIASFAAVLVIAALALLIATRLFSESPKVNPPRLPQPTLPSTQTQQPPSDDRPTFTLRPTDLPGGSGATPPFI